ncbi:MAG: ATP-binding protein [Ignavibacteriaceae bacterium]
MVKKKFLNKFSKYRFEIKHITIFFTVLILLQIVMVFVQKSSLNDFLKETQDWYKKYSAERLALITSTSMELLFENLFLNKSMSQMEDTKIINSFNVIFKQQLIQKAVNDICLILIRDKKIYVIDSGQKIESYLNGNLRPYNLYPNSHENAVDLFLSVKNKMRASEVIYSTLKNQKTYNILVPFVPDGEYLGVMYMKITPDFTFLTEEIGANFDKFSLIYTSLIFLGLIAIFLVSSQAVKERNEAQQELFEEHKELIKKEIRYEKESVFTKRIYHTHHKAEKIMGFIKEDVRQMNSENLDEIKSRVITYSNFISRIIYDMKWYDQEVNTIINPMFKTNINKIIEFILKHVFLRISSKNDMFEFELDLDNCLPIVHVNEFVVWEILEPIIQNSIDHGNKKSVRIKIITKYDKEKNTSLVSISDNGVGINEELLKTGEKGIKKIFMENESTKINRDINSGYGCYIAYQMAVGRCGWEMNAENLNEGGCRFTIKIKNLQQFN